MHLEISSNLYENFNYHVHIESSKQQFLSDATQSEIFSSSTLYSELSDVIYISIECYECYATQQHKQLTTLAHFSLNSSLLLSRF